MLLLKCPIRSGHHDSTANRSSGHCSCDLDRRYHRESRVAAVKADGGRAGQIRPKGRNFSAYLAGSWHGLDEQSHGLAENGSRAFGASGFRCPVEVAICRLPSALKAAHLDLPRPYSSFLNKIDHKWLDYGTRS